MGQAGSSIWTRYWGCEDDYGKNMFSRSGFERMANQLGGIKDGFLMLINDVPEVCELFAAFHMMDVATTHTIAKANHGRRERAERLISNFKGSPGLFQGCRSSGGQSVWNGAGTKFLSRSECADTDIA